MLFRFGGGSFGRVFGVHAGQGVHGPLGDGFTAPAPAGHGFLAEGGDGGGTVVAQGTPEQVAKNANSWTGRFLKDML